jgi:Sec-independent protein translocase protein TatA
LIGSQDLIVGLVIVVVLFGAKKIPDLAGVHRQVPEGVQEGVSEATEEPPAAPTAAAPTVAKACASC